MCEPLPHQRVGEVCFLPRSCFHGPRLSSRGFSIIQVLVSLLLLATLLTLGLFALSTIPVRCGQVPALSQMKQLHLAAQQMELDGVTTGTPNSDWTSYKGKPLTYEQWRSLLIEGKYLTPQDFTKLTTLTDNKGLFGYKAVPNAITVFAVCEDDPDTTPLFATKNWRGLDTKSLSGPPYETRGFAVFRKAGDGAILQNNQCQKADLIGSGGKFHYLPLQ